MAPARSAGTIKKAFVKKAEQLARLCVSPLRQERANEVSEHPKSKYILLLKIQPAPTQFSITKRDSRCRQFDKI